MPHRVLIPAVLLAVPAGAQPTAGPAAFPGEALITVTAPATPGRVLSPGVGLSGSALLDRQPRSMADALRGLPGVSVRPNSRGESVVRVRGSEERQTQVFLDGAPLSVPWDGRIDLGLVPAGLIGGLLLRKGAGAIEYGANAVAGVLDLNSRADGAVAQAQAGSLGLVNLSAAGVVPVGATRVTLAAAHQAQAALPVARGGALPFNQAPGERRTNTDLAASSLFAGISGLAGALDWRASVLHIDARRGVAPESDRNPANARFWRTPDWTLTQAQAALELPVGDATARATLWRQWFGQTIDAYSDASYTSLRAREGNDDDTLGGRLTLAHDLGRARLRWSLSGQIADHVQSDTAVPAGLAPSPLRYRQTLVSTGIEADVALGGGNALTLGAGYDQSANPRTGDKPAQPITAAPTVSAALRTRPAAGLKLTVSAGRRNRFPSARELFGEALGRFLANPALKPERVWLADAELQWQTGPLTLTLNPFWQQADGAIGQRIVRVGDASLRQRFNQAAATSLGVDAAVQIKLERHLTLELTGSALDASSAGQPLVQRPAHEVMIAIDWAVRAAFDLRAELRHVGPSRDLDPDGRLVRLAPGSEINLRGRLPVARIRGAQLALTAAVDNALNGLIIPQLGLPLPGRTVRLGLMLGG
jgi:iron complex outermembrane recepter protein